MMAGAQVFCPDWHALDNGEHHSVSLDHHSVVVGVQTKIYPAVAVGRPAGPQALLWNGDLFDVWKNAYYEFGAFGPDGLHMFGQPDMGDGSQLVRRQ